MKNLYEVTATRVRRSKNINGYCKLKDDLLVDKRYQVAHSEEEAIDFARLYISDKYDNIRASFVREY